MDEGVRFDALFRIAIIVTEAAKAFERGWPGGWLRRVAVPGNAGGAVEFRAVGVDQYGACDIGKFKVGAARVSFQ